VADIIQFQITFHFQSEISFHLLLIIISFHFISFRFSFLFLLSFLLHTLFTICRTNISVKIIWDYYWIGNSLLHYKPYRFLRGFDLPNQSDAQLLSKASYVVNVLLDFPDIRTPDQIRQVASNNVN
jgi:hypothetical protein